VPTHAGPAPTDPVASGVPTEVEPSPRLAPACDEAGVAHRRLVCADEALRAVDREVSELARLAEGSRHGDAVRLAQRAWLAGNDGCETAACLRERFERRRTELTAVMADIRLLRGTWYDGDDTVSVTETEPGQFDVEIFASFLPNPEMPESVRIGELMGRGVLEGDRIRVAPDDLPACTITLVPRGDVLEVLQDGSDSECGFGAGVYAGGTYTR
jgi:uncharacterized protein